MGVGMTQKEKGHKDHKVGQCKICKFGIFNTQLHSWFRGQGYLGLVHDMCKDRL